MGRAGGSRCQTVRWEVGPDTGLGCWGREMSYGQRCRAGHGWGRGTRYQAVDGEVCAERLDCGYGGVAGCWAMGLEVGLVPGCGWEGEAEC